MKKEIKTQIQINSSPQQVWQVLSNFENYGWNPFVKSIIGKVQQDNRIKVVLGPEGSKPMTFKPKVLVYKENKQLTWLGNLWMPGIFDGEHNFELLENVDGTTTFIHSEKFNGILVGLMAKKLDNEIKSGFEAMNLALKQEVERLN